MPTSNAPAGENSAFLRHLTVGQNVAEKPKIVTLCGFFRLVNIMAVSPYPRHALSLRRLQTFGQGRRLAALTDARGVQLLLSEVAGVREVGVREVGVREVGAREVGIYGVGAREVGAREVGVREVGALEAGVREVGAREVGAQFLSPSTLNYDTDSWPLFEPTALALASTARSRQDDVVFDNSRQPNFCSWL